MPSLSCLTLSHTYVHSSPSYIFLLFLLSVLPLSPNHSHTASLPLKHSLSFSDSLPSLLISTIFFYIPSFLIFAVLCYTIPPTPLVSPPPPRSKKLFFLSSPLTLSSSLLDNYTLPSFPLPPPSLCVHGHTQFLSLLKNILSILSHSSLHPHLISKHSSFFHLFIICSMPNSFTTVMVLSLSQQGTEFWEKRRKKKKINSGSNEVCFIPKVMSNSEQAKNQK